MKCWLKEGILFLLQLLMFYVFPLFAGPTDAMGIVFLILLATLVLSFAAGLLSDNRIRFLYPFMTAAAFIPSVWIYYNKSALIHSVWYLAASAAGLLAGAFIRFLFCRLK